MRPADRSGRLAARSAAAAPRIRPRPVSRSFPRFSGDRRRVAPFPLVVRPIRAFSSLPPQVSPTKHKESDHAPNFCARLRGGAVLVFWRAARTWFRDPSPTEFIVEKINSECAHIHRLPIRLTRFSGKLAPTPRTAIKNKWLAVQHYFVRFTARPKMILENNFIVHG
jgi:hypothetical protein